MNRLGTDSGEYHILENAARAVKDMPGISVEFGLREGGGSQYMIEAAMDTTLPQKVHLAVDPYGSLPYEWKQGKVAGWVYDDRMRNNALIGLYGMTIGSSVNFVFMCMTDDQYFLRFSDGLPTFVKGKEEILTDYCIAHLDAVHTLEAIVKQVDFLAPRMKPSAIIVIDDIKDFYDTETVENHLASLGFKVLEKGTKKGSYVKTKG